MATSNATFTSGKEEATENENMNGEQSPHHPPRNKDNFVKKNACAEKFCRVEDTLNELFECVLNKKIQLHEDVDHLQKILKDYMDSSDNKEATLRNEITLQAARFQKAERENSDLHRKVEFQSEAFGKSQKELLQIQMENSDLKKKLEKLTTDFEQTEKENRDLKKKLSTDFEKSESKFEQAETENSDLKKKLEKLTTDFEKSESKFEQAEIENSDLKKVLNQFKETEGHFKIILDKSKEENESLKVELGKYKDRVSELKQNLEESKKENYEISIKLKQLDEGSDSWGKFGAENSAQTGATQQHGKSDVKDAERSDGEDCTNLHQDIIDLMDDWYQRRYSDIYLTAINMSIGQSTVEEILFYALWKIYTNSRDAVMLQLKTLRKELYHPYSDESVLPDRPVLKDINNDLKKLLAKVTAKDAQRPFMEELRRSIVKKYPEFPCHNPKFTSYINASINLCRQLVLKSECLHLKTLQPDTNFNDSVFVLIAGKKEDSVKRVVIPALICVKNNAISILRKGTVSSMP